MKAIAILIFVLMAIGCAATTTKTDSFDGSVIVNQEPFVLTSADFGLPGTKLGFIWKKKVPDFIVLVVGVQGISSVRELAFNIDGEIIEIDKALQVFTDHEPGGKYPGWSFNRFPISLIKFRQIAAANNVRMKVVDINGRYTVGEFGRMKSFKYIDQSGHFDEFLVQVDTQLKSSK
jgi:hypothetical protein